MNQEKIDDLKGKIILDDLAKKKKLEDIVNQSANEYYLFGTFRQVIHQLIFLIIFISALVHHKLDPEISLLFILVFGAHFEIVRQGKIIDALIKLQKLNKN